MKITEFKDWYEQAQPREVAVYHRGYLPCDRAVATSGLSACNDLADHAWMLAKNGRVELVQRKLGAFDYEYLAIRNKR